MENAFEIGLLPVGFQNKVKRVGNTASGGVKKYLLDQGTSQFLVLDL